jgi:hypothetical protein
VNALWLSFFAGPLAWTAHELLSYALVKPACGAHLMILEYLVSLGTLALSAGGIYIAYRHGAAMQTPRTTPRFIALAALLMNVLFAFTIVMEALPQVVVNPCL